MKFYSARFLLVAVMGSLVVLSPNRRGAQQTDHERNMAVVKVSESHVVSIEVTIINELEAPILMPSCGTLLQEYVVCFPTAYFEQYDGVGWKKVEFEPNHLYGELADLPLTKIAPHASMQVHAAFSPDDYVWERDQKVRLVIPTWRASDKSRTDKNRILYATGPLNAPSAGRLAFLPKEFLPE
ncbi:MAG TPA: hypothetical protein VFP71_07465 [Candidatus Angelobacter sp.]|nr:hypothetical protein [Candidatus Angelobacter sp.]